MIKVTKADIADFFRLKCLDRYIIKKYLGTFLLSLALILAPAPDPGTMLIMALPMYLLYELCILFARRCDRKSPAHE